MIRDLSMLFRTPHTTDERPAAVTRMIRLFICLFRVRELCSVAKSLFRPDKQAVCVRTHIPASVRRSRPDLPLSGGVFAFS